LCACTDTEWLDIGAREIDSCPNGSSKKTFDFGSLTMTDALSDPILEVVAISCSALHFLAPPMGKRAFMSLAMQEETVDRSTPAALRAEID